MKSKKKIMYGNQLVQDYEYKQREADGKWQLLGLVYLNNDPEDPYQEPPVWITLNVFDYELEFC